MRSKARNRRKMKNIISSLKAELEIIRTALDRANADNISYCLYISDLTEKLKQQCPQN